MKDGETSGRCGGMAAEMQDSEGGMIRLETLIELKFLDSSFSSFLSYRKWTNNSLPSNSGQQYLSQQYAPPIVHIRRGAGGA